jgi:hypothetical protein
MTLAAVFVQGRQGETTICCAGHRLVALAGGLTSAFSEAETPWMASLAGLPAG